MIFAFAARQERDRTLGLLLGVAAAVACGCSRAPQAQVEPVAVVDAGSNTAGAGADATSGDGQPTTADADAFAPSPTNSGGLWIVDSAGAQVGVLIQRGHPSLSLGSGIDILRDGALVYSPAAGLFFGVQMSTGIVINPRLGVADSACSAPVVAGYYTEGNAISGQSYAFVFNEKWYRIEPYQPLELVTCGGTVADGPGGKCAPHSGTCRGFPVKAISPKLPLQFKGPLQFSWGAP